MSVLFTPEKANAALNAWQINDGIAGNFNNKGFSEFTNGTTTSTSPNTIYVWIDIAYNADSSYCNGMNDGWSKWNTYWFHIAYIGLNDQDKINVRPVSGSYTQNDTEIGSIGGWWLGGNATPDDGFTQAGSRGYRYTREDNPNNMYKLALYKRNDGQGGGIWQPNI